MTRTLSLLAPTQLTFVSGGTDEQWTIRISEFQILNGIAGHRGFALVNPEGVIVRELHGLATTQDGSAMPIGLNASDRISVHEFSGQTNLWDWNHSAIAVSGSFEDLAGRWQAAQQCGTQINELNTHYPFGGLGWSFGFHATNSNAAHSTLAACMNVDPLALPLEGGALVTPGLGTLLLSSAEISQAASSWHPALESLVSLSSLLPPAPYDPNPVVSSTHNTDGSWTYSYSNSDSITAYSSGESYLLTGGGQTYHSYGNSTPWDFSDDIYHYVLNEFDLQNLAWGAQWGETDFWNSIHGEWWTDDAFIENLCLENCCSAPPPPIDIELLLQQGLSGQPLSPDDYAVLTDYLLNHMGLSDPSYATAPTPDPSPPPSDPPPSDPPPNDPPPDPPYDPYYDPNPYEPCYCP